MEIPQSKVTVEYHDPFGIFPLIVEDLGRRLPLRNLQWQSPIRPLRQIQTLHIELVPDAQTLAASEPPVIVSKHSTEIVDHSQHTIKGYSQQRRHQIPGLKTSPYLKLYLLRCDDKDQYKEVARKCLQDWISENGSKDASVRHSHDAFEWMIIHVVFPNTAAANEPRWKESPRDSDDPKERSNSSAKWSGKGSRTVFDRLRADFNQSNKFSPDRVAQIRLKRENVPSSFVPPPKGTIFVNETAQERDSAWTDLITKIKILILGPFDARVRQYEADIVVQESRRALPGWNFCTFFIHKEGLARALQSVGLTEDALAIYDELQIGLESNFRESFMKSNTAAPASFADFTDGIAERLRRSHTPATSQLGLDECREKIVRSQISLFDFSQYIFLRQRILVLEIAKSHSRPGHASSGSRSETIIHLGDLCKRTCGFVHSNARVLGQELAQAFTEEPPDSNSAQDSIDVWIWDTCAAGLQDTADAATTKWSPADSPGKGAMSQQGIHTRDGLSVKGPSDDDNHGPVELARHRLALSLMQERVLRSMAERRGWVVQVSNSSDVYSPLTVVDLAHPCTGSQDSSNLKQATAQRGDEICPDETVFQDKYEAVCVEILSSCCVTGQSRVFLHTLVDLATVYAQRGKMALSAKCLKRIIDSSSGMDASFPASRGRTLYATCLRALGQEAEFVQVGLEILHDFAKARALPLTYTPVLSEPAGNTTGGRGFLDEVIEISRLCPATSSLPLSEFFPTIDLSTHITHREGCPGILLALSLRHILPETFTADEIRIVLSSAVDSGQELCFTCFTTALAPTLTHLVLTSTTIAHGLYFADRIVVAAGRVEFVHDFGRSHAKVTRPTARRIRHDVSAVADVDQRPFIFVYPPKDCPVLKISPDRRVSTIEKRKLEIRLKSGPSELLSLKFKIRPTSADLRLYLTQAESAGMSVSATENVIRLSRSPGSAAVLADATVTVLLPYDLQSRRKGLQISTQIEAHCETKDGSFSVQSSTALPADLPMEVEATDIFHVGALFSKFTLHSTDQMPHMVLDATLDESQVFAVAAPPISPLPVLLTSGNPIRLAYRIRRKDCGRHVERSGKLSLQISHISCAQILHGTLQASFLRDLEKSSVHALSQFLVPILAQRFEQLYGPSEAMTQITQQVLRVRSFEEFGWHDIIQTLSPHLHESVENWLRDWHDSNPELKIDMASDVAEDICKMTISVEVPHIDIVHDVLVKLLPDANAVRDGKDGLMLNLPSPAVIQVRQTDQWSVRSLYGTSSDQDAHQMCRFELEVHADAELWRINGARRFQFDGTDVSTSVDFEITLVPLKLGTHPLPTVEIRRTPGRVDAPGSGVEHENRGKDSAFTMALNILSIADTVRVVDLGDETPLRKL